MDTRFADLVADCAFNKIIIMIIIIIIKSNIIVVSSTDITNFKCWDIQYVKNSNGPLGSLRMSFATVSKEEDGGRLAYS